MGRGGGGGGGGGPDPMEPPTGSATITALFFMNWP